MTNEGARLAALVTSLRDAYAEARNHWRDDVAEQFDRWYWKDIERGTQSVLDELQQFEQTLAEVEDAIRRLDA